MKSETGWIVKFDNFDVDSSKLIASWQSEQVFDSKTEAILHGITVCRLWPSGAGYLQADPVPVVKPCEVDKCLIDSLLDAHSN